VLLRSAGGISETATIVTSGGALAVGTVGTGRNAGAVTVDGVNRTVTGR
jgi:hypothetical protein